MNLTSSKNWKMVRLGDLVLSVVDNRGKTPPVVESGFELLEVNAITEKNRFPDYGLVKKFVDKETYDSWFRTGHIKKGDIIVPTVGTIGNVAISLKDKGSIAQNLIALRFKEENNPMFLYYLLASPKFKKQIFNLDIGGVQPSVKVPHLLDSEISIPKSYDEQEEIADMLGSLDDKIELLKKENRTLESIAQTLFKEWFIDFNFPESTGKMIDSELGEIPDGWRVYELKETVDTINGYSYKGIELKENSTEALVTLKSFDRNGGFQTRGFKPFAGNPKVDQEVFIGDLIVAHTDLTQDAEVLGNPAFIFENGGFERMYITMDLVKVVSKLKQIKNPFLYFLMQTRDFKSHCVGYSNGTTVLHMSKRAIPEYKISLPIDLKLCEKFSDFAEHSIYKISNNIVEIQTLSKLRDELLNKIFNV